MNKILDLAIRIKNAALARRKKIFAPYSNINKEIGEVLVNEGFLESIKKAEYLGKKALEVVIKYERRNPILTNILIVSKPSIHVYTKFSGIAEIQKRGRITIIISTSKGIMTGKEAYKKKLGGEVLFKIW